MNLLARANKQAAASYQQHTTLLNKATLCDSTNSKQNSSNSAFLRKSLWLLTAQKSKTLREIVTASQGSCQACQYLRLHGLGCLSAPAASPTKAVPHSSCTQSDSVGLAGKTQSGSH